MFNDTDIRLMQTALTLAWEGRFSTSPNPRVGCVIAHGDQIVGQGFHIRAGSPHAEVYALQQAGKLAQGATAYVTLEPCSHHGRTPPCAEALIKAKVKRVVAAMTDPNPLVSGKGLTLLTQSGIQTESGLLEQKARLLNRGFLSRIERGRPFIRLKCAASLDGKTALSNGQSQWITGEAARSDVQILRAESCAVLTGIGTVLADNPKLNVRTFPTLRQPIRIILDSRLQTPLDSFVIQDSNSLSIICTLVSDTQKHAPYLKHPNTSILCLSEKDGRINLNELMQQLAQQGIGEILVEAGAKLNTALIEAGLVDEIVLYQSAKMLGNSAKGLFLLPENNRILSETPDFFPSSADILGNDIKITLYNKKFS
ncbi:bifunctional diaminohydroxyphosphoribosylaminopyrimidine deaminase/5-amino-6-(5-phosphoribosylamino)uracil reductase RibD [Neisseria wadsworthii]|uniref:Riboflavin biosynthesis protein RibD n=1 Tax=Neisseria wadsworthii 9715 TaxID=1030841 RepID=G4CPP6_9NEIS|nr:bifunctional diaminohydroxyphosphoribosylaminopyrimidine deaminase/5-amino-6-(5-phosphoribosylamino)uracil reductase RibD [Neisseria wadsworthii]EGZ47616.1 riboflavin biosynthesis protein RibD [Neisseria wadsworthii 9715]QMT34849.1 bifunctional diaminohydroxyphosphoribosylaminopyrimidine deaminase/5-amino-6-(5-phosphoribosylamino)uracil reductase RibD [Neisseria wadsworthii]